MNVADEIARRLGEGLAVEARADLAIDFCYITILLESVNCLLRIGPDHLQNMLCLKSRKKQLDQTYYATYNVVDDPKLVWMLLVFSYQIAPSFFVSSFVTQKDIHK